MVYYRYGRFVSYYGESKGQIVSTIKDFFEELKDFLGVEAPRSIPEEDEIESVDKLVVTWTLPCMQGGLEDAHISDDVLFRFSSNAYDHMIRQLEELKHNFGDLYAFAITHMYTAFLPQTAVDLARDHFSKVKYGMHVGRLLDKSAQAKKELREATGERYAELRPTRVPDVFKTPTGVYIKIDDEEK